jgi:hypothetical protein
VVENSGNDRDLRTPGTLPCTPALTAAPTVTFAQPLGGGGNTLVVAPGGVGEAANSRVAFPVKSICMKKAAAVVALRPKLTSKRSCYVRLVIVRVIMSCVI